MARYQPAASQRFVYAVFATLLAVFLVLTPVEEWVVTDVAAAMLLVSLVWGWRGLGRLGPEAWLVYGGFVLYFLGGVLSLANNQDWGFAGWRFERYYPFLLIVLTMGLIAWLHRPLLPVLVWGSLGAAGVMATYAGYEVQVLGHERAGLEAGAFGLFGLYVNNFGHVAYYHAVVLLAAALVTPRPLPRLLFLAGVLLAFYAGFASGTRGALLGFMAALPVVVGVYVWRLAPDRRSARRALLLAGSVVAVGILLFSLSSFWHYYVMRGLHQLVRVESGDTHFNSVAGRILMWRGSLMIWHDHPLLGTGIGDGFRDLKELIASGRLAWQGREPTFTMHNIYMEALATTGTVGLLTLLVGIFLLPARYFFRALHATPANDLWGRTAALAGLGVLALHAVFGISQSWLSLRGLPHHLLTLVLLVGGTPLFRRPARP